MSDFAIVAPETRLQNFLERAGLRGFPWITAIVLYTISWGWLFIVRNSYWGADWESYVFPELTTFNFDTLGFAPWLELNQILFNVFGPGLMRLLTFLFFFCSGISLFGISQKFVLLSLNDRKILTLLFLVLPFNTARVALMVFHYSEAYFYFFLAWYLSITSRSNKIYFLSVLLFFLSFQMHSLLIFYLIPFCHIFFLAKIKTLGEFFYWFRKNVLRFFLPLIYWILRSIFWPEQVQYHNIDLGVILDSQNLFAVLLFVGFCLFFIQQKTNFRFKSSLVVVLVGCVTTIIGHVPYVLYGFFSVNGSMLLDYLIVWFGRTSWYTRHQMLQPLGVALVVVGLSQFLDGSHIAFKKSFIAIFLAVAMLFNVGFGLEHVVDYSKQTAIITQLKLAGDAESTEYYQIFDQTKAINARGQIMYYRAWSGLIGLAYSSETASKKIVEVICKPRADSRMVLIEGPKTHWEAFKNWVSNGDMGFKVTVDDTPGACKPEMVTSEKVSGAIPILFYFTGAKN